MKWLARFFFGSAPVADGSDERAARLLSFFNEANRRLEMHGRAYRG